MGRMKQTKGRQHTLNSPSGTPIIISTMVFFKFECCKDDGAVVQSAAESSHLTTQREGKPILLPKVKSQSHRPADKPVKQLPVDLDFTEGTTTSITSHEEDPRELPVMKELAPFDPSYVSPLEDALSTSELVNHDLKPESLSKILYRKDLVLLIHIQEQSNMATMMDEEVDPSLQRALTTIATCTKHVPDTLQVILYLPHLYPHRQLWERRVRQLTSTSFFTFPRFAGVAALDNLPKQPASGSTAQYYVLDNRTGNFITRQRILSNFQRLNQLDPNFPRKVHDMCERWKEMPSELSFEQAILQQESASTTSCSPRKSASRRSSSKKALDGSPRQVADVRLYITDEA